MASLEKHNAGQISLIYQALIEAMARIEQLERDLKEITDYLGLERKK